MYYPEREENHMRAGINAVLIITLIFVSSCGGEEGSSFTGHQIIDSEDLDFREEIEVTASFAGETNGPSPPVFWRSSHRNTRP